jgi:hypothetical protein
VNLRYLGILARDLSNFQDLIDEIIDGNLSWPKHINNDVSSDQRRVPFEAEGFRSNGTP